MTEHFPRNIVSAETCPHCLVRTDHGHNPDRCASKDLPKAARTNKSIDGEILREIYQGMSEFIEAAESLLEWVPVCSEGSSGDLRQKRLRAAIEQLRGVLA